MADLEKGKPTAEQESPKVEIAPEAPKPPETPENLDALGEQYLAFIEGSRDEAKSKAEQQFQAAPERVGVKPEEAAQAAAETGIAAERAQADAALEAAAKGAETEIETRVGKVEAPKEAPPTPKAETPPEKPPEKTKAGAEAGSEEDRQKLEAEYERLIQEEYTQDEELRAMGQKFEQQYNLTEIEDELTPEQKAVTQEIRASNESLADRMAEFVKKLKPSIIPGRDGALKHFMKAVKSLEMTQMVKLDNQVRELRRKKEEIKQKLEVSK